MGGDDFRSAAHICCFLRYQFSLFLPPGQLSGFQRLATVYQLPVSSFYFQISSFQFPVSNFQTCFAAFPELMNTFVLSVEKG